MPNLNLNNNMNIRISTIHHSPYPLQHAGRNLAVVGLQERSNLSTICSMFGQLVRNVEHLHERFLVHCDGKVWVNLNLQTFGIHL